MCYNEIDRIGRKGRAHGKEGCLITEAFNLLPQEKQKTILEAAAAEFAEHGYEKASTNRMVQRAGIGKGMLFYYFGSKLELYHYLMDRIGQLMEGYGKQLLCHPEKLGIIETLQHATKVKMEAYGENPALLDFIGRLYLHPEEAAVSEEAKERFFSQMAARERVMQQLFAKADMESLRRDIPRERLVKYLHWAMEGYTQHIVNQIRSAAVKRTSDLELAPFLAELDVYMEDLKRIYYKKT